MSPNVPHRDVKRVLQREEKGRAVLSRLAERFLVSAEDLIDWYKHDLEYFGSACEEDAAWVVRDYLSRYKVGPMDRDPDMHRCSECKHFKGLKAWAPCTVKGLYTVNDMPQRCEKFLR